MRTCVRCGGEYEQVPAPLHCPDCGARTLDSAGLAMWQSERDRLAGERLVPVHRFDGPADKAILEEIFTDHKVPYTVTGPQLDPLLGGAHLGSGWGLLLVPEEAEAQALHLLKLYEESVPAE